MLQNVGMRLCANALCFVSLATLTVACSSDSSATGPDADPSQPAADAANLPGPDAGAELDPGDYAAADVSLINLYAGAWHVQDGVGTVSGDAVQCAVEFNGPNQDFFLGTSALQFDITTEPNQISLMIVRFDCSTAGGDDRDVLAAPLSLFASQGRLIEVWNEPNSNPAPDNFETMTRLAGTVTDTEFSYQNCVKAASLANGCFEMTLIRESDPDNLQMAFKVPLNPPGTVFDLSATLVRSDWPGGLP